MLAALVSGKSSLSSWLLEASLLLGLSLVEGERQGGRGKKEKGEGGREGGSLWCLFLQGHTIYGELKSVPKSGSKNGQECS